jgi:acyl-CoA thioester hydrolase
VNDKRRLHETAVELEVAFHDVDGLQVVWHGNYLKYFELARTALLRSRGLDVHDIGRLGYRLVVVETHCRHTFPLRYAERFRVAAWFRDVDYRLKVAFELTNLAHDRRAARGHTTLVTTDAQGQLLMGTPQAILDRLT